MKGSCRESVSVGNIPRRNQRRVIVPEEKNRLAKKFESWRPILSLEREWRSKNGKTAKEIRGSPAWKRTRKRVVGGNRAEYLAINARIISTREIYSNCLPLSFRNIFLSFPILFSIYIYIYKTAYRLHSQNFGNLETKSVFQYPRISNSRPFDPSVTNRGASINEENRFTRSKTYKMMHMIDRLDSRWCRNEPTRQLVSFEARNKQQPLLRDFLRKLVSGKFVPWAPERVHRDVWRRKPGGGKSEVSQLVLLRGKRNRRGRRVRRARKVFPRWRRRFYYTVIVHRTEYLSSPFRRELRSATFARRLLSLFSRKRGYTRHPRPRECAQRAESFPAAGESISKISIR